MVTTFSDVISKLLVPKLLSKKKLVYGINLPFFQVAMNHGWLGKSTPAPTFKWKPYPDFSVTVQ